MAMPILAASVAVVGLFGPATHTDGRPPVNPFRCVEDEVQAELEGQAICLHVEGDGWRVVYPPAPPAQPVPWEGLAITG